MIGGRASRRPEHIALAQLIEQAAQFGTVPTARRCLLFEYPRASRHAQRRDLCRVVLVLGGDAGITDLHERAPYLTSVVVGPSGFSSRAFDSATASCSFCSSNCRNGKPVRTRMSPTKPVVTAVTCTFCGFTSLLLDTVRSAQTCCQCQSTCIFPAMTRYRESHRLLCRWVRPGSAPGRCLRSSAEAARTAVC